MKGIKKFPISFWNTTSINDCDPIKTVEMWKDLGITLAMSPSYTADDKPKVIKLLTRAAQLDIKVIMCDYRTFWFNLTELGEDGYRRLYREAIADYSNYSAVYGFFVGDEPDALASTDAFKAVRIQQETNPGLLAYLNLLPWFDWIGERMGTPALAPYLDRFASEGNAKLLSYDCYTQMWEGEKGYNDYFNNLREYYEAVKRLNIPFFNIVLSCGHYDYRCPSKDDMLWQLTTSVAHGASGVSWFFIQLPGIWDNYRNAPINQLGERTEQFNWLSEVNRVFNGYCGLIIKDLVIDTCYHVENAYGGMELFKPFGDIEDITSQTPLIASRFHDNKGGIYYIVSVNSPEKSAVIKLKFRADAKIQRCQYGNTFIPISESEVEFRLPPAQLALFKVE